MDSQSSALILCLGVTPCLQRTLLFESFRPGEVNRAQRVIVTSSGKATNVARVIQSMGGGACLLGLIGGETGKQFQAGIQQEGLSSSLVTSSSPTRICQTLIDQSSGKVTELVEEAETLSQADIQALQASLTEHVQDAEWLVISGSLPPDSSVTFYRDIIEQAQTAGCRVILDSQKQPLKEALAAKPWLVKLNREELSNTLGFSCQTATETQDAAKTLLELGAQHVLVTCGAESVLWIDSESMQAWQPPTITPINPIGSGDALAAGLAYGLSRGDEVADAIRLGIACGAVNALTQTPGIVEPDTVETLLMQVVSL